MATYLDYGKKMQARIQLLLQNEGIEGTPRSYEAFMRLDHAFRKIIAANIPLVLSDN
jgi:hypothetical protein